MNLNHAVRVFLPTPIYHRLVTSSIAKRLARGSVWSLLGSATSRILVLVSMILVARVLGQESFGEFGLIQATLGTVGLMAGLGLGGTATRFVAQYATTDPARAGHVIALVMLVSTSTVILAVTVLITTSGLIARTLLDAPHLQTALIWGALLMCATAFRGIQNGVFAGLERFDLIAKLNILGGVLTLLAIVPLAHLMNIKGALLALAICNIMVWFIGLVFLLAELRMQGICVRYQGCWAYWRILTGYSLPSLLASLVATPVLWFAMTLVTRSEGGFSELGLYHAAYQWHGPMVFIPMILMSVSIPVLVQEWEAGRRARFRSVTFWICGLMFAISLPPITLVSFLSQWIMSFYGHGFREGWMVLILLLAAVPFHALAKISSGALLSMNRAWWIFSVNLIWGVTLLTIAEWLIPTFGVKGLAIAFLTAHSILGTLSFGLVFIGSRQLSASQLTTDKTNKREGS